MTNDTVIAPMAPSEDTQHTIPPEVTEKVVSGGDLSDLNAAQRAEYYTAVCRSLGLNPLTKPFEFLTLNGKLRLYALRDCADQLRRIHGISIYITNRERMGDIYIVTARAKDRTGREDESTGAVPLENLKGDALANALMKCETKTKRRVTLSIAGLGWLDETKLETIPQRHVISNDPDPLPLGEGISEGATDTHPTVEQIDRLFELAQSCQEPKELLGRRLREVMGLGGEVHISKKFLRQSMTTPQYTVALAYYTQLLKRQIEEDVPDGTPGPTATVPPSMSTDEQPASQAMKEVVPSVPFASSSAPGPDADVAERDRQRLRAEVAGWPLRVSQAEIEHIIVHHPYNKARTLLWKARTPAPTATPIESAAD